MSADKSFFLTHPEAVDLYHRAVSSPELVRVESDASRFRGGAAGRSYSHERVLRAIARFVVEPAAIELAAEGRGGPWFRVYGPEVRRGVVERLGRVVEREVGERSPAEGEG